MPTVFKSIINQAFGLGAVGGGIGGAAVKKAVSMGIKRGVFSNEAGLGSSVMVHSAADVKEPVIQGMWGIFEVFIDTIVVCSLTAFAILSSNAMGTVSKTGEMVDGSPLVILAFEKSLGKFAGDFISISIIIFAFATIIGCRITSYNVCYTKLLRIERLALPYPEQWICTDEILKMTVSKLWRKFV